MYKFRAYDHNQYNVIGSAECFSLKNYVMNFSPNRVVINKAYGIDFYVPVTFSTDGV